MGASQESGTRTTVSATTETIARLPHHYIAARTFPLNDSMIRAGTIITCFLSVGVYIFNGSVFPNYLLHKLVYISDEKVAEIGLGVDDESLQRNLALALLYTRARLLNLTESQARGGAVAVPTPTPKVVVVAPAKKPLSAAATAAATTPTTPTHVATPTALQGVPALPTFSPVPSTMLKFRPWMKENEPPPPPITSTTGRLLRMVISLAGGSHAQCFGIHTASKKVMINYSKHLCRDDAAIEMRVSANGPWGPYLLTGEAAIEAVKSTSLSKSRGEWSPNRVAAVLQRTPVNDLPVGGIFVLLVSGKKMNVPIICNNFVKVTLHPKSRVYIIMNVETGLFYLIAADPGNSPRVTEYIALAERHVSFAHTSADSQTCRDLNNQFIASKPSDMQLSVVIGLHFFVLGRAVKKDHYSDIRATKVFHKELGALCTLPPTAAEAVPVESTPLVAAALDFGKHEIPPKRPNEGIWMNSIEFDGQVDNHCIVTHLVNKIFSLVRQLPVSEAQRMLMFARLLIAAIAINPQYVLRGPDVINCKDNAGSVRFGGTDVDYALVGTGMSFTDGPDELKVSPYTTDIAIAAALCGHGLILPALHISGNFMLATRVETPTRPPPRLSFEHADSYHVVLGCLHHSLSSELNFKATLFVEFVGVPTRCDDQLASEAVRHAAMQAVATSTLLFGNSSAVLSAKASFMSDLESELSHDHLNEIYARRGGKKFFTPHLQYFLILLFRNLIKRGHAVRLWIETYNGKMKMGEMSNQDEGVKLSEVFNRSVAVAHAQAHLDGDHGAVDSSIFSEARSLNNIMMPLATYCAGCSHLSNAEEGEPGPTAAELKEAAQMRINVVAGLGFPITTVEPGKIVVFSGVEDLAEAMNGTVVDRNNGNVNYSGDAAVTTFYRLTGDVKRRLTSPNDFIYASFYNKSLQSWLHGNVWGGLLSTMVNGGRDGLRAGRTLIAELCAFLKNGLSRENTARVEIVVQSTGQPTWTAILDRLNSSFTDTISSADVHVIPASVLIFGQLRGFAPLLFLSAQRERLNARLYADALSALVRVSHGDGPSVLKLTRTMTSLRRYPKVDDFLMQASASLAVLLGVEGEAVTAEIEQENATGDDDEPISDAALVGLKHAALWRHVFFTPPVHGAVPLPPPPTQSFFESIGILAVIIHKDFPSSDAALEPFAIAAVAAFAETRAKHLNNLSAAAKMKRAINTSLHKRRLALSRRQLNKSNRYAELAAIREQEAAVEEEEGDSDAVIDAPAVKGKAVKAMAKNKSTVPKKKSSRRERKSGTKQTRGQKEKYDVHGKGDEEEEEEESDSKDSEAGFVRKRTTARVQKKIKP